MTPSKEDYIKAILELGGDTQMIPNKAIAKAVGVKAASVTEMINRLVAEELVTYIPYKGVKVTRKGLNLASDLIRKHRIWEVFLYEHLGYSWDEIHQEADQLEHVSTDKLINRLYHYLGEPSHDPHGSVIPKPGINLLETCQERTDLASLQAGDHFQIVATSEETSHLHYMDQKGLALGAIYQVKEIDQYGQLIILEDPNKEQVVIGLPTGSEIFVQVIDPLN